MTGRRVPGLPTHSAHGLTLTHSVIYDDASRQASATHDGWTNTYAYDTAGRLQSESQDGAVLSYQYDRAGNRTRVAWPDSQFVQYTYDALGRMEGAWLNNPDPAANPNTGDLVVYAYDPLSRMVTARFGNGARTDYAWEPDNDLDSLDHEWDSGTLSGGVAFDYGYNKAGQLLSEAIDNGVFNWAPPVSATVAYNAANGLNQYTFINGQILTYSANGTLSTDGTWTFTYDAENRLTIATDGTTQADYDYGPLGRRVAKRVNAVTTRFLRDASDHVWAVYDGSGASLAAANLQTRYVYGAGVNVPIAQIDETGAGQQILYYHQNRLGSVVALTRASEGALSAPVRDYLDIRRTTLML